MMDFLLAYRPLWAVLVSLLAAGAVLLTPSRRQNLRETWTFLAAAAKLALVLSMVPTILAGGTIETAPLTLAPHVTLHFKVDALGMMFALVASILWVVTSIYSVGYMRSLDEKHQNGYYASFAVCVSSALGLAFSANLLTFFVFFEMLTIATYPLVVHKRNEEAIKSGRKYLGYTLLAGQCLLVAVVWTMYLAPGAEFTAGGFLGAAIESGRASDSALRGLFLLFILGVGVKAGLMPIHAWLPAAMVAPTPVSALLHAVAVVKAGVFGVLRIIGFVYGPDAVKYLGVGNMLAVVAAVTIVTASVIALGQDNLKKRLAYSTVSQLSYIVLGAALGTPAAILGATLHIAAHAFMKITLFFCAGGIYAHAHKTKVSELDGLGRQMPITFAAFTVGSLGLAGVPLVIGFVSKIEIGRGALEANQWIYVAVLMLSALLNIAYFFPIILRGYFGDANRKVAFNESNWKLLAPPVLAAAVAILLGVAPNLGVHFFDLATDVAQSVTATHSLAAGSVVP